MKIKNPLIYILASILLIVFFQNCKKTNNAPLTTIKNVTGYVQKGPFITGSSITVYDLNSDLSPTGKSYNTQTTDNKGAFTLDNITLSSAYATLKADGFYYNEVQGALSAAPITLYALTDVSDKTNININLLTDLEKARVESLIKNGKSFADAKQQAQKEILTIFDIVKPDIKPSEDLNIAGSGDDNAILLAISSILQGKLNEASLTELLSGISNDIKDDGILNNDTIISELLTNAVYLDTAFIKTGLINKYGQLGQTFIDLDFGKYIDSFISKTSLKLTGSTIYYPESPNPYISSGPNLLPLEDSIFNFAGNDGSFSLYAYIPYENELIIKIRCLDSIDTTLYDNPLIYTDKITYRYGDIVSGVYELTIPFDSLLYYGGCYLALVDINGGIACHNFLIKYYENGSLTPTRTKAIKIN